MNAYEVAIQLTLHNGVSNALAAVTMSLAKTNAEAEKLKANLATIKSQLLLGGLGIAAGVGIAAGFAPAISAAEKFERALLRVKNIGGITPAYVARLRGMALAGALPIGAVGTVEAFKDLHTAFGSADDAFRFLPQFARFAAVGRIAYGRSDSDNDRDLLDLARVAERRGGSRSPEAMSRALDLVARVRAASGGVLGGADLLAFSGRTGSAFRMMSDEGIARMMGVMAEMKGSGAGTALMSAFQNLLFGRGTEQSGHYLRQFGLVDEAKNLRELRSIYGVHADAHRNKITAGALRGADLLASDPVAWVQQYMLPALAAKGITDQAGIAKAITQMLSNRTGANEFSLIATQLPTILKDARLVGASQGIDAQYRAAMANPVGRIEQLRSRWDTGLTNLGEAALPIVVPLVEGLTAGLQRFNQAAEKDPALLTGLAYGAAGLSAALVGGGLLMTVRGLAGAFRLLAAPLVAMSGAGPALGVLASGLGLLRGALGVAGAGAAGYAVGSVINDGISGLLSARAGRDTSLGVELYNLLHPEDRGPSRPQSVMPRQSVVQVATAINLDGRRVADAVTVHQAREAARPRTGSPFFDGRIDLMSPGLGYAR